MFLLSWATSSSISNVAKAIDSSSAIYRLVGEDRAQLDRSLGIDHGLLHLHNVHFDAGSAYKLIILCANPGERIGVFLGNRVNPFLEQGFEGCRQVYLAKCGAGRDSVGRKTKSLARPGMNTSNLSEIILQRKFFGKGGCPSEYPRPLRARAIFEPGSARSAFPMKPGARGAPLHTGRNNASGMYLFRAFAWSNQDKRKEPSIKTHAIGKSRASMIGTFIWIGILCVGAFAWNSSGSRNGSAAHSGGSARGY